MTGFDDSTLGISVYNVVFRVGAVTAEQAHEHLKNFWRSDVERSEVDDGIRYLEKRRFVFVADGVIRPVHTLDGGKAHPIRRSGANKRELALQ